MFFVVVCFKVSTSCEYTGPSGYLYAINGSLSFQSNVDDSLSFQSNVDGLSNELTISVEFLGCGEFFYHRLFTHKHEHKHMNTNT